MDGRSKQGRRMPIGWPVAIVACVTVVALAASTVVHRVLSWPENLAKAVGELFQAKTSISGTSISLPAEDIAELALIKRRILVFTKQENSVFGSSSVRIIEGVFEMKAGYDLKKSKFSMTFDRDAKTVTVTLPAPDILSLTTIKQDTYHLDEGVFKKPTTQENDQGNAENLEQARKEALELGLLREVDERMRERLRDVLSAFVAPDKIRFAGEAPEAIAPPKM